MRFPRATGRAGIRAGRVGWECTLEALGQRLHCGKCGAKGALVEVGERAPAGTEAALTAYRGKRHVPP